MIKKIVTFLLLISALQSFSQKLIYKSNGNILNSENQKISPNKVRELLTNNENLLANYNAGRSKKTAGNILLIGGISLLIADLARGVTDSGITGKPIGNGQYVLQDEGNNYPSLITYVGLAAVLVAIPIKIGFSKKIKNVVADYNNSKATGNYQFDKQKLDFITNSKGIGFRLTLN